MGIENMRRWPMYIVFASCILLTLSLLNSWSMETELRNKLADISTQLQECSKVRQECSKQQTKCMEESLSLYEQKQSYLSRVNELDQEKSLLNGTIAEYKNKAAKAESQVNHTLIDVDLCRTELQSLKNLQISKTATLETLRLEKETLTSKLDERKKRIEELEKEVDKLKLALTTKSAVNPPAPSRMTPAAEPPKLSPSLNAHHPINEPVLENNAKEELEDTNLADDINDFDQQL